jgi:hypothetical protein
MVWGNRSSAPDNSVALVASPGPPRLLLPISLFKFAYFLLDTRKFVSPCVRKRLVFLLPASNSSISWSSSQERRGRLRHPRNSKQCQ